MTIFAEVTKNECIIISQVTYCGLQLVIGLFILLFFMTMQFSMKFYNYDR